MNVVPDIPRIYSALAEWLCCLVFVICLEQRFPTKWKSILISGSMLLVQLLFMGLTGTVPLFLWIPCMIFAVLLMIGYLYFCCNICFLDAAYFGMLAFVMAEFFASLEWQLARFFHLERMPFGKLSVLFMLLVYGVAFGVMYFLLRKRLPKDGRMNIRYQEFLSACIAAMVVFAISNISFLSIQTPFSSLYTAEMANIRTLVDLGGLAILYAHLTQCCEIRIRRELEAVESVLQTQYIQYQLSKETIDLINYKYHDLKHQINVLRSENDSERRNEFLNQMEQEIHFYEAQNKTGNKVLDTVLTSKHLTCDKKDITFTVVADGKLLNFMDTMDICSIFGNALDNAIECETKIEEKEKRLIHVTVTKQKNFVLMRFENYFDGSLNMKEGILQTTKKNGEFHGYGIKSIRYAVGKYNGAVHINNKDNWFELQILIPIKEGM